MLSNLVIRDVVLIERLEIAFGPGLCVLTGETGTGKSILLDALGLALGGRGEARLVRQGAKQAVVTAEFDPPADHPVYELLGEGGIELEPGEPVLLRRSLNREGRSRAYINDQPVAIQLLRRTGRQLLEVHGQFDTHGLLDQRTHRGVLDAYGVDAQALARVEAAYQAWKAAESDRQAAEAESARARAEEDYLRHTLGELDELTPEAGEEAALEDKRARLMNRERILAALSRAHQALGGEGGADRGVAEAQRELGRIDELAGEAVQNVIEGLDRAAAEIADALHNIQALADDEDADSQTLERIEERLFALRAAARKHGCQVDELPALRERVAERLSLAADQDARLAELARQAEAARADYVAAAQDLTKRREAAATELDRAVGAELAPLKLDKAKFATEVTPLAESEWGPGGIDRVAFLVATNPGAAPGPINRIASGGELARFMLALKVVLARVGTVPTLIFDEIDTGVGGATADAVGERLARLARERQVMVVTHAPQVAARGTRHYRVWKAERAETTVTGVEPLTGGSRREEIARMLAGAEITQEARAAADRLLAAG